MRSAILVTTTALAMTLLAGDAAAHQIVDVRMSVEAPSFVAARQRFSYRVVADDLANDSAFGVVVTTALPPSVTFVKASGAGWSCSESKLKVTCSAEEIGPGPNAIVIEVIAPVTPGPLTTSVTVTTLGSFDDNAVNDRASATTTVYDPAACPPASVQLLPVDATNPPRLAWTAVPTATSYAVYASVEGERSVVVATTTDTAISLPFARGNVEWRVEAALGGCPTVSSAVGRFVSGGAPPALRVTTFAGRADAAGAADGPLATARFIAPSGLAVDSRGDLYVADSGTFTIRRIANGAVTTISGVSGTAGAIDGRPAGFAEPAGLAITPADDFLFIADRGNHAVRLRYPGDATLGFVITIGGALTQRGMADGLYEVSRFNAPSAVAADPRGRLYVADSGNHRVRKVTTVPGYVGYYTSETFAGGGEGMADGPRIQAQFRAPAGVAVDGEEVVYVADSGNQTIRKIANGVVTTLAGSPGARGSDDGYGAAARFDTPTAMALDARGNLYVCDSGNQTIRKVSPSGLVTTVAGLAGSEGASDGTGAAARFSTPSAIAIDANGTIYVADRGNHRVVVATVTSAAAAAGPRRRVAR